jgi:hypothetical protein
MNNVRLQLRAASTAFALFACASALLFVLAGGIRNVAAALPLPLPKRLPAFMPLETLATLLDLRPFIVLGAGVLLAAAIVLVLRNQFLDRAVQMLASMLTLVLASIVGVVAGFAGVIAISSHRLVVPAGSIPALICLAIVLVASFATVETLRSSLLLRSLAVLALGIAAPLVLLYGA